MRIVHLNWPKSTDKGPVQPHIVCDNAAALPLDHKVNNMQIENYFTKQNETTSFSRLQGSSFAKEIAGDFNPIHDEDNKRFCVPGDLLFSVVLHQLGLNQYMNFAFGGMVSGDVPLCFTTTDEGNINVSDEKNKTYLTVTRQGEHADNPALVEQIIARYVAFSGQTFPHILVPLMTENNVMINPARPLVIYESMRIDINNFEAKSTELELTSSTLDVDGKRGSVCLKFDLNYEGEKIGSGEKRLLLSGLRPFDKEQVDQLIQKYSEWKNAYKASDK